MKTKEMKIGIAAPLSLNTLRTHLPKDLKKPLPNGTGPVVVSSLVEGLLARGAKVSVYTLDPTVTRPTKWEGPSLSIFVGHQGRRPRIRACSFFQREARQIIKFIHKDRPHLVNAHWSCEYGFAAAVSSHHHLISLRDHSRTIWGYHPDYYRLSRYLMDVCVRRTGRNFSVNSPHLGAQFSPWRKRLPVLPDSLSSAHVTRTPKQLPRGDIRIVSILTGWSPLKNPKPALAAMPLLRKALGRRVEYHLFGPGYAPQQPARQWARDHGLDRDVVFHGFRPHDHLMAILPGFDLLLHPSLEESFGDTLLEAMAAGVPIVAGENSGAVPWVLGQGKYGMLANVRSASDLAQSMEKLLSRPEFYNTFSRRGFARVLKDFSSLPVADKYLNRYRQILHRRTAR